MSNLPIVLFLLGTVFMFLGLRWQSPANEEAMTALKGLAYMKRELMLVQNEVHSFEEKLQIVQQIELQGPVLREKNHREIERKVKNKLYSLKTKEHRATASGGEVEPTRIISPKYQEVLELAAKGQSIPEIAKHLLLSQDAVMMVLQTQSTGAER